MDPRENGNVRVNANVGLPPSGTEEEALGGIWETLRERVRSYVARRHADAYLAEEIAATVVMRLWRARAKYDPVTLKWPLIRVSIRRALYDYWRASNRERERSARADVPGCPTPEDDFAEAECWRRILEAVAAMPDRTRQTYIAVDLEAQAIEEVAKRRSVSRKMIEKDLTAARKAVRAVIKSYFASERVHG